MRLILSCPNSMRKIQKLQELFILYKLLKVQKSPYNSTVMNRVLNSDPKQVTTGLSSSRTQFIYSTINISMLHLNSNTITTGTNSRQRVHIQIPIVIILNCLDIHAIMTRIISRQCHISSVCQFKPST